MPLQPPGTFIDSLSASDPVGSADKVQTLDDHIREIIGRTKATFPNVTGAVTPTHTELNFVDGVTSAIQTQIDGKAASSHNHSAADLTSGTVPDARFPATLPAISGANLTNLDASDLASGTVPDARLSSQVCLKDTAITGADGANAADPGHRGLPLNSQTADYTVATADNGTGIIASSSCDEVTLTSTSLPAGGMVTIYNSLAASAALTIVQGSGATLYLAGVGTTGNKTVSGVGACFAVAVHIGGGTYIVSGAGVS